MSLADRERRSLVERFGGQGSANLGLEVMASSDRPETPTRRNHEQLLASRGHPSKLPLAARGL